MDTERQRGAAREVAEERRRLHEELRRVREELWRLHEERRRLRADRAVWSRPRCARCPFNDLARPDEG